MARKKVDDVELDMTSFMNLMIVLVPVLLLNMTIASTSILDIKLPAGGDGAGGAQENQQIELIIHEEYMTLNFPAGVYMDTFPKQDGKYDYKALSAKLQALKPAIEQSIGKEKKDILILSEEKTSYQTLVSTMDAVRSYKAVVVADVVDAELFPDISLGDAPVLASAEAGEAQ